MKFLVVALFSLLAVSSLAKNLPHQKGPIPEGRIINGQPAKNGQFPHQVFLNLFAATYVTHCGGSIIAPTWVLTSAHCLDNIQRVDALMGDVDHVLSPTLIKSKTLIMHPEYSAEKLQNDIGLIELSEAIKYTDTIKPIKLAKDDVTFFGEEAIVSGFGMMYDTLPLPSDYLNYVGMRVIGNDMCRALYGPFIIASHLCAEGAESMHQGVCSMDSGGPLIIRKKDEDDILIGVIQFSSKPCSSSLPSGFARVTKFVKWVQDTTKLDL